MPSDRSSLQALKRLISEVDLLLETTTPLPENRTARSRELLRAALALADDLLIQNSRLEDSPAAILGSKGGKAIAKRGSDYFRELAAKRTTHAGGRPKKSTKNPN
jgi:hypothetical protein